MSCTPRIIINSFQARFRELNHIIEPVDIVIPQIRTKRQVEACQK
jgi:hypothetical protein